MAMDDIEVKLVVAVEGAVEDYAIYVGSVERWHDREAVLNDPEQRDSTLRLAIENVISRGSKYEGKKATTLFDWESKGLEWRR